MKGIKKGMINLSLLLLLSALLALSFLWQSRSLSFYQEISQLTGQYRQQKLALWQMPAFDCDNLPLHDAGPVIYPFQIQSVESELALNGYCQRLELFKKMPRSKQQVGLFEQFINEELVEDFAPQIEQLPQIYWFKAEQNHWQLNGDLYALVIAEGDLHIQGQGTLRGTVITAGDLILDDEIQLVYNKDLVQELVLALRKWQLATQGWHDFEK